MFDFSSWRVRTRLTVGFGVVCVLLVASVVMGLMAMGRMGADLKAVVADHFPRIVAAANLSTQIDVIAIALRNMMLNADAADRERQTQVIAQSRQEVVRLFDTLDKTLTEPKDRALLQKVKEQRALYLARNNCWASSGATRPIKAANTWPASCSRCWPATRLPSARWWNPRKTPS